MRTARRFLVVALLAGAPAATAADLHNVLVDYTLTSWGEKDGLVSTTIRAIAQDREGYLWIGTEAGPVRFDGARFVAWQPPPGGPSLPPAPVRALCAASDGAIWFGYGDGHGVSRFSHGTLRTYAAADGLPEGAITVILETRDHVMWAGGSAGLFRLLEGRWQRALFPASGDVMVTHASIDHSGRLLVATAAAVHRQTADRRGFERLTPAIDGLRAVAAGPGDTIWVTDAMFGFRRLGASGPPASERGRGSRLLRDSRGNLWVGTTTKGLWRARVEPEPGRRAALEKANALTGFSDDGVTALFEDADGNIWAGTLDGLNRLSPHKITPVTDLGLVSAVEGSPDGSVWVGSADTLTRFTGGGTLERTTRTLPAPLSALHVDAQGTVFTAMGARVDRITEPGAAPLPVASAGLQRVTLLMSDRRGGLWMADDAGQFAHWAGGRGSRVALPPGFVGGVVASEVTRDGRLWLTSSRGQVSVLAPDGHARTYTTADGLTAGVYRAILEDARGTVWFGGTTGLTRLADGRFETLSARDRFPGAPLTTILDDQAGSLWLGVEASHIIRVEHSELARAFLDPAHPIHYRVFDKFDGVAGTPRWFGNRAGVRAADGRLWFVAGRGVAIIDPDDLPVGRARPARVRVERIVADEREVAPAATLPSRTARVQFDYTAINLTSPLRTHFRYRLVGFDADWIDAGAQRRASYTNLPPGPYRFTVMATNADGTWSDAATVPFAVDPMFYQRVWFIALCVGGVVMAVAGAWRLHVRRVRHEFALLVGERARLGREIHDTLLQGLFGLALRCDTLAAAPGLVDDRVRQQFLQMRKELQDYIADARGSIRDLRSPRPVSGDLTTALRHVADRVTAGTGVICEIDVTGVTRRCPAAVEEQVLRIAQEAVSNAVRHGGGTTVRLELAYGPSAIRLLVRDDGCGFSQADAAAATGHYGLVLMKERAESIGGTLTIQTSRAEGATVEAVVPA